MLETLLQPNDTEERCGLLLRDGTPVELPNVAEDRVNSFEIDAADMLPYLTGDRVAGTWHTHPRSEPHLSGEDYKGFVGWPDLKHYVIGLGGTVKCYEIRNGAVLECA